MIAPRRRSTPARPDPVVSLTDAAAAKLAELTKEETNPEIGLRVYVYSGGCSGYRYGMMLEDQPTADDNVLHANGVRVYIDSQQRAAHQGLARSTTSTRSWARASRSTTRTPSPAAAAAPASAPRRTRARRAPARTDPHRRRPRSASDRRPRSRPIGDLPTPDAAGTPRRRFR